MMRRLINWDAALNAKRRFKRLLSIFLDPKERLARRVKALKATRRVADNYVDNPKLSLVVLSFNHKETVRPILKALRQTKADELIVCEDGSIDGSDRVWLRELNRPNDFLIRSNDIHEIRAYDRAIHLARGEFVCILQDDDIPPPDGTWVEQALELFDRHPKLAILGVHQGWCLDFAGPTTSVARKVFGEWEEYIATGGMPFSEIPFVDSVLGIPFMFIEGVSVGPVFYRRDVFLALGGFDLRFSRPSEPGVWFSYEICLRAWLCGWHVGLFGPVPFQRHVGRQGTYMFSYFERDRNTWDNLMRIKRTYRDKIAAVDQTVNELNEGLKIPRVVEPLSGEPQ